MPSRLQLAEVRQKMKERISGEAGARKDSRTSDTIRIVLRGAVSPW